MAKTDQELLLNGEIGYVQVNKKSGLVEWIRVDKEESSCIVYASKDGTLKISQTRGK